MHIRSCIAAAGLLALAACGSSGTKSDENGSAAAKGGGAPAGAVKLQPGQWEMTMETLNVTAPGLPPAILASMKRPKVTTQNCMTPEDAEGPNGKFLSGGDQGNCTHEGFTMAGGRLHGSTTCTAPGGAGKTTMAMDGQYAPQSMNIAMTMTSDMGGRQLKVESRMTGRRIGDCPAGKGS